MSNQYYELYLADVLTLTKSLVIKNEATANAINDQLLLKDFGLIISDDKEDWKYYRNLNGEYYFTDKEITSDKLMQVISTDDLSIINFNKSALEIHRQTKKDYSVGSSFYNELVRKYPEQELLIKGILNPIDITLSVEAEDNKILYYDNQLVEENELSLIPNLQEWIDKYFFRWNVPAYGIIDDLYTAAHLGIMWLNIPMTILNLRLAACKTYQAHSYHIQQYLASHGKLDVYLEFMTKKQALFLYRNILYIERNVGKEETFKLLISHILSDRRIALNAWNLNHNVKRLGNKISPEIVDDLESVWMYPEAELVFEKLNDYTGATTKRNNTVEELLVKQIPIAKDNLKNIPEAITTTEEKFISSQYSALNTKVLESSMIDYTNGDPYKLIDVLLNQWMYWSSTGRYTSVIRIKHPITLDDINLTVKNAFILFLYAYNKSVGIELENVPNLTAIRVRRLTLPTKEQLMAIVDRNKVDPLVAEAAIKIATKEDLSPFLRGEFPEDNATEFVIGSNYPSIITFYEDCLKIHKRILMHRDLFCYREEMYERGQTERMVDMLYQDIDVNLADEQLYVEWFDANNLALGVITPSRWFEFALEILNTATGWNLVKHTSLRDIQRAMLAIMSKLSSYSVHYLQSVNSQPLTLIEWPSIRIGKQGYFKSNIEQCEIANINSVWNAKAKCSFQMDLLEMGKDIESVLYKPKETHSLDDSVKFSCKYRNKNKFVLSLPKVELMDYIATAL